MLGHAYSMTHTNVSSKHACAHTYTESVMVSFRSPNCEGMVPSRLLWCKVLGTKQTREAKCGRGGRGREVGIDS